MISAFNFAEHIFSCISQRSKLNLTIVHTGQLSLEVELETISSFISQYVGLQSVKYDDDMEGSGRGLIEEQWRVQLQ
jgi:hypothetical protein